MILMGANPFREPLEGVGHENQDFLCPEMANPHPHPFQYLHYTPLCPEQIRNQQRSVKCIG
jgi:hypothetical protein